MTSQDNHNHFCIYCGARLVANQHFCTQCGKKVYHGPQTEVVRVSSKYESQVNRIEEDYNLKQSRASELVEKLFEPNHASYSRFTSAIRKSNQLFYNQLQITRKMIELDDSGLVDDEIENKIGLLNTFVDKMEDLINELVILLSSNKKDNDDVNDLFSDMDDLIDSVKNY